MAAGRTKRRLGPALLAGLVAGLLAYPASAGAVDHLVMIKEVFAGAPGATTTDFVELQMRSAGQNRVAGNKVHVYDDTGLPQATHTFAADVAGTASQSSLLVARQSAVNFFGVGADLLDATVEIPFGAGKACYEDVDNTTAGIIDCVSWGAYTGDPNGEDATAGTADDTGTPAAATGIPGGNALERDISGGTSPTQLDAGDDTNDSAADFDLLPTATPRNNAGAVTSTASAAAVVSGVLEVDTAPGVVNRIRVSRPAAGTVGISDTLAPVTAGAGCVQHHVAEVRCPLPTGSTVDLGLGDGNDRLTVVNGYDIVVDAGGGNDRLTLRNGDDTAHGGAGKDEITGGLGTDVLRGETGNDTIFADESPAATSPDSVFCGGGATDHAFADASDTVPVAGPERCELVN